MDTTEETKKHEVPPEFKVMHMGCITCHPAASLGDIFTTLCGITKPIEGIAGPNPGRCVVCVELWPIHRKKFHPERG